MKKVYWGKRLLFAVIMRMISKYFLYFSFCGSWGDYTLIKKENMLIFPDKIQNKIDMKQAACLYINPLTAFCFIDIMKKNNIKTAVHTAGYSAVGKVFSKLAKLNNFKIINILRR